jgi:hypothetical protein
MEIGRPMQYLVAPGLYENRPARYTLVSTGEPGSDVWLVEALVEQDDFQFQTLHTFGEGYRPVVGIVGDDGSVVIEEGRVFELLTAGPGTRAKRRGSYQDTTDPSTAATEDEERRAYELLLDRLTPEQRSSFLSTGSFECVTEGPGPASGRWTLHVQTRSDNPATARLQIRKEHQYLCVHVTEKIPWPDRLLAYKLALESGEIWKAHPGMMYASVCV